jgi:hypothetical protein
MKCCMNAYVCFDDRSIVIYSNLNTQYILALDNTISVAMRNPLSNPMFYTQNF